MRILAVVSGPKTRMNVQRRPSCTFILSQGPARGGKTLKWRQYPVGTSRMNVQHRQPRPRAGQGEHPNAGRGSGRARLHHHATPRTQGLSHNRPEDVLVCQPTDTRGVPHRWLGGSLSHKTGEVRACSALAGTDHWDATSSAAPGWGRGDQGPGPRVTRAQPWRALNRGFLLLMT